MQGPTSGTALIDALIDEVRIGDNLVLQADDRAPLQLLIDRFVAACLGRIPVVRVNVAAPWRGPVPDGMTVLDWSPVSTGETSSLPWALPPATTLEDALTQLRAVDEAVGTGAAFVFDRLTAVQAAWDEDAALSLFLAACPRLYRRRSLALWPVEAEHHRPSFLRRLAEITQVVVELTTADEGLSLTVRKADGRAIGVVGRTVHAEVVDGDLRGTEPPTRTRERLGTMIREQRLAKGLSQAELARKVDISPSALSQVERGVRGPSGDTLVRLWEVLGVPFGPTEPGPIGFAIERRSGRQRAPLQEGLIGERVVDDPRAGEVWLLEAAPGGRGDRSPFVVKVPETVTVVRGILDLRMGGRVETLHEGDALVSWATPITGWANPGDAPTEVVWILYRPDPSGHEVPWR